MLARNFDYTGGSLLFFMDGKTVSSIVGKIYYEKKKLKWAYDFINNMFNDNNHCHGSYLKEFQKVTT